MSSVIDLGTNIAGVREQLKEEGRLMVLKRRQNVSPYLDENARLRNVKHGTPNGRIVSQIPATLYYQWKKDWQKNYATHMKWHEYRRIKLNNPDFKNLRMINGKV